jgi:hypothetical protein
MHKYIFLKIFGGVVPSAMIDSPWYIFKSSLMSARQRFVFLWRLVPVPLPLLAGAYEGNLAHGWRRLWWCRTHDRGFDDAKGANTASQAVDAAEAGSVMPEPLRPLMQRRQGLWRQSSSGRWGERGGVDDARASRAIVMAEVGLMMLEPLEPLLWRRRGWWCRSPSGCCYRGGGVDNAGAPRAVVTAEDMLLCWIKQMCATLFGGSISGVLISLQMVERVLCFLAAFSYEGVKHG